MSWDRGRTLANANAMTITINATKAVPLPMPASALDFPRMRPPCARISPNATMPVMIAGTAVR